MKIHQFLSYIFLFFTFSILAQPAATSASDVQQGLKQKKAMQESSLVKNVPFKNIGPSIMSGRVVDIDANPDNPAEFYVGYASGGVWHTINNGTTFEPILDSSDTQNVGDIAVDWKNRVIWVGTGENNSSRSSYAGIGILKSSDNGKTWKNLGLNDSHHIGRILINENNPDEVVIGSTGHLYSSNKERGIYKTTDGGNTWSQKLYVDDMSGIIDLAHSPNNFNIMYAASWTKDRKAWNFDGSGNNSAIYKSTDGGDTWSKISTTSSGFPTGQGVGRIGLAVYDDTTVYAFHDSQFRRPSKEKKGDTEGLEKDDFKTMSNSEFLDLDDKQLDGFLKMNGFQEKYRAQNVKQMVRSGNVKPIDIAKYLEDANSMLFDSPVVSAEIFRSDDGGASWKKTHSEYLEDVNYSYGYYFGEIRVAPQNKNAIYIMGVPIIKSKDGGKNFTSINAENVHSDHQALWVNPKTAGHLINGNDGGLNMSYDDGDNWIKLNQPSVGQLYAINVDNQKPYHVYGGLQDNGVWTGPHNAQENKSWHQRGEYPWKGIMGGDGMQVQIDSRDTDIVYTGLQFGNYYRLNRETGDRKYIQPKHQLGENPYRFNWQTPILLSPHNQDILYLGGNKLMRSMNQGNDWDAISDDLTTGGKKGNVAYGTITSISESPFQFGLIYVGSDDGYVNVTKNAGGSWERISNALPKDLWVSRVVASQHKKERVYATLNGYRWDDFSVYVYMSDNYGETWKNISSNIPLSPVNVIKEDPVNPNILYVGTDNGAYTTFDMGNNWEAFSHGLPNVAVHDIVIQSEAKDILLGTHGRSIYKGDLEALQEFGTGKSSSTVVFETETVRSNRRWGGSFGKWGRVFEPSTTFTFFSDSSGKQNVRLLSDKGNELNSFSVNADKGFNYLDYDLSISEKAKVALMKGNTSININKAQNGKYYLPKGTYTVQVGSSSKSFEVK